MNKITIKAPAKINFTLDILGVKEGFHQLNSLVASISLWDKVILKKRQDKRVSIAVDGVDLLIPPQENNAYKTAVRFMEEFDVNGVDIILKKAIPIGGGLGGSSADISAVVKGMQKLYNVEKDVFPLLNKLGSDTSYMYNGGWATISGKGEKITPVKFKGKFYLLLLMAEQSVTAGACYKEFDNQNKIYPQSTDKAVELLEQNKGEEFLSYLKNDLYPPAKALLPEIEKNYLALSKVGKAIMTGSGSVTVGVYLTKCQRDKAYKELYPIFKDKLLKAKTI